MEDVNTGIGSQAQTSSDSTARDRLDRLEHMLRKNLTLSNPFRDFDPPWSFQSGNAVLNALGTKETISTPAGDLEVYIQGQHDLLQFRGGPWKAAWNEQMTDLWCLACTFRDRYLHRRVTVVYENAGEMEIREITIPDDLYPDERAIEILRDYYDL